MYKPTAKSYFCGGGLMLIGLQDAGINLVKSLEIDAVCCDTLRHNFDHEVDNRDITNITVLGQQKTDIIIGTYPCKKYSSAADLSGTRNGEDLYLHFFRHVAIERPEAFVCENVPGMKAFPVVMEAMTKIPDYYVQVFCPVDAANWLPQRRERLIIIGTKRNIFISPPQPVYRRVLLKDIISPCPDMIIPNYVVKRLKKGYRDLPIISDPSNRSELAPTCVAHYSKDRSTRLVVDKSHPMGVRPYTVREYARLQGVPDWFKFSGTDADAYRQIGNGVAVPVGRWVGQELIKYFN